MARDHYKVLGVDKRATEDELKQAYRTLARRYHPDMTGSDPDKTERFKKISDAYTVLSDAKRRRQYDLFGDAEDEGIENPFSMFVDVISDFFRNDAEVPRPGCDVETPLDLSFKDAWLGLEDAEVEVHLLRGCETCTGKGFAENVEMKKCPKCKGEGEVKRKIGLKRSCGKCEGSGEVPSRFCRDCKGKKSRKKTEQLKVRVPPGVNTGTRLRLKGRGPVGTVGAISGDLYIKLYVGDDPRFIREGTSLRTTISVPLKTALQGGETEVPLPDGNLVLKIPARTQGGQMFRIRGRGFPELGKKERGDFLVQVKVKIPGELDEEGEKKLQEFAAHLPEKEI
ncbi:MAG: DnaJ domain-containing protein [Deltaproteobacteria bacterium]|nr:DnaJ domain-containing protein [Deltaproteobacteria bacterium]